MFDNVDTPETSPTTTVNTTTKAELLNRVKLAIDAGENSLREIAETIALTQEDFGARQREIATAIGRSVSWVNRLLKWRKCGYKEYSPFGPTTTAGRVSHAKQRTNVSKPRKAGTEPKADPDDAEASAHKRKAEYAEAETPASTVTNPLDGFKSAVDYWLPKMDNNAKREAVSYAIKKSGVPV